MEQHGKIRQSNPEDDALFRLGSWLQNAGYEFVTVTPATHARVIGRDPSREAVSLEDVFGWNLPFRPAILPETALALLREADAVDENPGLLRSRVRFSTLGDSIYVHSGYPTNDEEAVFFGPDTYRFATLIGHTLDILNRHDLRVIADIGCGSGAGGIVAEKILRESSPQLILSDINPMALRYAEINAALAGVANPILREGDLFAPIGAPIDLIVANPPYLVDPQARFYRHGGGKLGSGLSTRIVEEGLPRLDANGILILYTATPVVSGRDTFRESILEALDHPDIEHDYREIDPDVFGEELENPAYAGVDRIAAVSLVVQVRSPLVSETRARTRQQEVPALLSA
jgi:hypothetical protein